MARCSASSAISSRWWRRSPGKRRPRPRDGGQPSGPIRGGEMSGLFPLILLTAGLFGAILLLYSAFSAPSVGRVSAKRLESVRVRHSRSTEVAAQAQLRRIFANRQNGVEGLAQRLIPNPALLRKRIEQTGRRWTLGQYATASVGIAVIVMLVLIFKGVPAYAAIPFGTMVGLGLPHFAISTLIKRRITLFTTRFPDAIDLMVRGLRS